MSEELSGYQLSRNWFNFSFENPDMVRPIHTAIFMWAIEKCNRLGWKKKFGFPTSHAMDAIGVKSKNTYLKALNDLVDWGFIEMIQESKNQHTASIIAISKFDTAHDTALDRANTQHTHQHLNATPTGTDTINKQTNKETNKQENKSARVLQVPVPKQLQIEGFEDRFLDYWDYMSEAHNREPNLQAVESNFRRLLELQMKGHDPLKVIDQTMAAGNKSFYPLKDKEFNKEDEQNNRSPFRPDSVHL